MTEPPGPGRAEGSRVEGLRSAVRRFFLEHGDGFGLDPESLAVEYVLNPGGFVNHSFRVSGGRERFHLKLSTTGEGRAALARWRRLGRLLARYHAPPILEWVDLGEAAGLLFPFLQGKPPALTVEVLDEVLPVLRALHGDAELRAELRGEGGEVREGAEPGGAAERAEAAEMREGAAPTAAEVYFGGYHDRFTEDLRHVRAHQPPFVEEALLDRLEEEVERLAGTVRGAACFQEVVEHPVHRDPWLTNVLWQGPGHWWLLDWDDIGVGDPMGDLAMLTGPSAEDLAPLKMFDRVASGLPDPQRDRLRLLGRASLLDWVIDPLADWVEAAAVPERMEQVRLEKQRVHRGALALYRERYGGAWPG